MLAVAWASLKKEVLEVLRDKRTLLLTILVPLGFYPAVSMMSKDLDHKQRGKVNGRVINIAVSGWEDDSAVMEFNLVDEKIVWRVADKRELDVLLDSGKADVFLEVKKEMVEGLEQRKVKIHYHSSATGTIAYEKVKLFLSALKAAKVGERMKGKEYLLEPIEIIGEKNRATIREISGDKFGGIGAYFIVFLAFTGCMAVAVDTAAGEKERGTLEAILVTPASFVGVAFGKLLFIMIMGFVSVLSTIGGIMIMVIGYSDNKGNSHSEFNFMEVGCASLLGISVMLMVLVLFFAAILFAFSILSKSNKEAHVRSSILMIVVAMSLVYCIIPGVELTNTVLWIPVLNGAMSMKMLWSGAMPVRDYFLVLAILIALSTLVLIWISRKVNGDREKVLLKN